MRVLGIGVILSLFALSCGTGRLENPNPYPGYCTEEPGSVWEVSHYTDGVFSPDGRMVVFVYTGNPYGNPPGRDTIGLYLYRLADKTFTGILTGYLYTFPVPHDIDFSPDGDWLVFSWGRQIWKIKVNGDSLTQLTFSGENFYPRWSPDGRKIIYEQGYGDSPGTWMMDPDGRKKHKVGDRWWFSDWVPDGGHIIFEDWEGNHPVIAYADTSGEGYRVLLRGVELNIIQIDGLAYSSDGSKILFVAQRPGEGPMVWVMDADGSNPVPLANGWSPEWYENNRVLYTNTSDGSIYVMDSNGCNKTPFIGDFNFLEGGE